MFQWNFVGIDIEALPAYVLPFRVVASLHE